MANKKTKTHNKTGSDRKSLCIRRFFFRKMLSFLERHPSRLFARIEIQILLLATAKGFRRKGACVLFSKDPLKKYADFTKDSLMDQELSHLTFLNKEAADLKRKQTEAERKHLYLAAFRLGRLVRKLVGFTDPEDLQRLVFFLYSNIGITMTGEIPGQLLVSECFFSNVYTAEDCRFISAMDAGIIAGICRTGKLIFNQRITEGCLYCIAATSRRDCCKKEFYSD